MRCGSHRLFRRVSAFSIPVYDPSESVRSAQLGTPYMRWVSDSYPRRAWAGTEFDNRSIIVRNDGDVGGYVHVEIWDLTGNVMVAYTQWADHGAPGYRWLDPGQSRAIYFANDWTNPTAEGNAWTYPGGDRSYEFRVFSSTNMYDWTRTDTVAWAIEEYISVGSRIVVPPDLVTARIAILDSLGNVVSVVGKGQPLQVVGRVIRLDTNGGIADRQVTVEHRVVGVTDWQLDGTATTNSSGDFNRAVTAPSPSGGPFTLEYRARFSGGGALSLTARLLAVAEALLFG